MYRQARILNKNTGMIYFGQIDSAVENIQGYPLIEIPDDGKDYAYINGNVVEKTATLAEIKTALLEQVNTARLAPFSVNITDTEGVTGDYYLTLTDEVILKILVLVKKAEIIGVASDEFINVATGLPEYKTFSLAEIQSVQTEVIQRDDYFKRKINQVKTAGTAGALEIIETEINELIGV